MRRSRIFAPSGSSANLQLKSDYGNAESGGYADQACPIFPGMVKRYHWGFDDPAKATGSEEEVFAVFRRVRDEIGKVFGAYAAGINLGMQLSQ